MTQNEKDLLLKDLSARLPYGVRVHHLGNHKHNLYKLEAIAAVNYEMFITSQGPYMDNCPFIAKCTGIEEIKPYLFPLSSMTEEQREELYKIGWYLDGDKIYSCFRNYDDVNYKTHTDCFELINWCYKNKLDINGFIPMGLALDATGLNIY